MNNKQQKGTVLPAYIVTFMLSVLLSGITNNVAAATTSTSQKSGAQDTTSSAPIAGTQDPLEKYNRVIFEFNDTVDVYFLKPIATFYNKIMPSVLNKGIHNMFNNIGELPTIANDVLQFNFYQMANDMWRLGINTTVGIGGFFDVASKMDLKPYTNDFGLTMAKWGWKNSTYVVWPFFGPSTIRDGIEIPVDYFAFSIYPYINPESTRYEIYGWGIIDRRAQLLQFQSVFEEAAVDRYVFMRNAYLQRRTSLIEDTFHRDYHGQNAECLIGDQPGAVLEPLDKVEKTTEEKSTTEANKDADSKQKTEQNKTVAASQDKAQEQKPVVARSNAPMPVSAADNY